MSYAEYVLHPHHPDERADLFAAEDGGGVEDEFRALLVGLIRSFKPKLILETGTYLGSLTRTLADACRLNGFGTVITVEADRERVAVARKHLSRGSDVQLVHARSDEWLSIYDGPPFNLVVLDSDLRARVKEFTLICDRHLAPGAPVFVHDTSRLRAAGGMADWPDYPSALDALGLPSLECPLSRGWRLFQMPAG